MTSGGKGFAWQAITATVFVVIAIGYGVVLLVAGGGLPRPGATSYEVDALVPTSASLTTGARVTVAGVRVGSVREIRREGAASRLRLEISDDRVTPLPADSRVELRGRTPVGENYVAVLPGKAKGSLAAGAVLVPSKTDEYVDVDEILSVLRGDTRKRARDLLRSTGRALDGRGADLGKVVGDGSRMISELARIVDTVHPRREALAGLVADVGEIGRAVGDRGAAIRVLSTDGAKAMSAVARQDSALSDVLQQLPPTLERAGTASEVVRLTTVRSAPVLDDLAAALRQVRPSVRSLRPVAKTVDALLSELGRATPPLRETVTALSSASGPLAAAMPALRRVFCEVNPLVDHLAPYTADTLDTFTGLGSLANAYDATGHTARLGVLFSDNTVAGMPDEVSSATQKLLHTGLLAPLTARSYDAYPEPGGAGVSKADPDGPQGPTQVPATGFVYPRVAAAC